MVLNSLLDLQNVRITKKGFRNKPQLLSDIVAHKF
jgi:hypothetical protein